MNISWLISGAVALLASFCLFVLFGYYNYFRDLRLGHEDLDKKVQIVGRRLSAELLIAPRGAPDAVALQLAKDLKLSDVNYGSETEILKAPKSETSIYSIAPIPFLESKYHLRISAPKPEKGLYFNVSVLGACILLIGLMLGTGLLLQTRYLKRHLIRPIQSLVDTSTGERSVSEGWPVELQEISEKLNNSFQQREQEVFSQIARGVVHDIKTVLQSLKVASDLATETPNDQRLNNLLKVSQSKLPTLLDLINTTLDGSRDISVSAQHRPISETIKRSIETVKSLPSSEKTDIQFVPNVELLVAHDSTQIERVVTNILKNGVEAIDTKGKPGVLRVSFNLADKDFLGIVVEDSGPGLPKKPDSVFRLLKSTKVHGLGLGLSVSKKIVEAHGGRLIASSSKELQGAKFEILLPKGGSV